MEVSLREIKGGGRVKKYPTENVGFSRWIDCVKGLHKVKGTVACLWLRFMLLQDWGIWLFLIFWENGDHFNSISSAFPVSLDV